VRRADLAEFPAQGNAPGAFSTTRPGGTEAFRDRDRIYGTVDDKGGECLGRKTRMMAYQE